MIAHLRYAKYIAVHKWWVFWYSIGLGVPLLGLLHDISKLRPSEWFPYTHFFYPPVIVERRDASGYYNPAAFDDQSFERAWMLHQSRNKHHWQHFVQIRAGSSHCGPSDRRARGYSRPWEEGLVPQDDGGWKCARCGSTDIMRAVKVLPMPDRYRREMIADWLGAGRAQHSVGIHIWCAANKGKMVLHPETRAWVEQTILALPVRDWRSKEVRNARPV